MIRKLIDMLKLSIPAPWVVYLAIGLIAASFVGGWVVRGWQCDAGKLKAERVATKTENAVADIVNEKSSDYETKREQTNVTREIHTRTIREIYRDVEVPSNCAPPDAAVGVLRSAVTAANAAASGQSGGSVPSPLPASAATD